MPMQCDISAHTVVTWQKGQFTQNSCQVKECKAKFGNAAKGEFGNWSPVSEYGDAHVEEP
jgi:hypothetical protein